MIIEKHLIIIPGLGDDHPAYDLSASLFKKRGYTVHIPLIQWKESPSTFSEKKNQLLSLVDSLQGDIYVLGISAGGPVALSLFAERKEHVRRVVTLCSPYTYQYDHEGTLLGRALSELAPSLSHLSSRYGDILSYHGFFDATVWTSLSRYPDIDDKTIPFFIHALTIFLGLTLYVSSIDRFFVKK